MHTTFNVFPYLITLLLTICEGTTVLYNGTTVLYNGTTVLYNGTTVLYTTGIFTGWCYMKDVVLLVLHLCCFYVSHFGLFTSLPIEL